MPKYFQKPSANCSLGSDVVADAVLDLGELEGDILVFGGAYSNLQALEAMMKVAKDLNIPPERTIHTGDVVAYCAQPLETSELLQRSGVHCLMGNCEESIGFSKLDCGCGFPEDSKCNEYSVNWYSHVMQELEGRRDLKEWMASMPRRIDFRAAGRRFAVVHGSPRNISEFLWPSSPESELHACFEALPKGIDAVLCGHSGIPFARQLRRSFGAAVLRAPARLWINAGVIGMPANDGTERGWCMVLSSNGTTLRVAQRALHYNSSGASQAIFAVPHLVRGYADSLLSGIWPSHDVLPLEEQMATGEPIQEKVYTFEGQKPLPIFHKILLVTATLAVASAVVSIWKPRGGRLQ